MYGPLATTIFLLTPVLCFHKTVFDYDAKDVYFTHSYHDGNILPSRFFSVNIAQSIMIVLFSTSSNQGSHSYQPRIKNHEDICFVWVFTKILHITYFYIKKNSTFNIHVIFLLIRPLWFDFLLCVKMVEHFVHFFLHETNLFVEFSEKSNNITFQGHH